MRHTSLHARHLQRLLTAAVLGAALAALLSVTGSAAAPSRKFYDDDPLTRAPETQDASKAATQDVELFADLLLNLFAHPGDPAQNVRARNLNSIDEVPDSGWFTNRILAHELTPERVARGPIEGPPPADGKWTIVRAKTAGQSPGFTARDANGQIWFVSFDAKNTPEAQSAAAVVASKLFWALGYWQVENFIARIRPEELSIDEGVMFTPPSGNRRPMTQRDVDDVLRRAARSPDGSYRMLAARGLPGHVIGPFKYFGTRSDDPNDLVPHEHRRELRALKVFGAWTNLVDMKAGNTLDTVITQDGRGIIRHYLQDVGSTFGIGAEGPHDWLEGWEYLYQGDTLAKRLFTLGFYLQPWQTVDYERHPAVGRFEGTAFDPAAWKPRVPTSAFLHARADDNFWAARRVAAFTDEQIRAATKTGEYSDPKAADFLADILIKRRDAIARAFLPAVNPLVDFSLENGTLSFANAAVDARVADAPAGGYQAVWATFDNATGATSPIGNPTRGSGTRIEAPPGLPTQAGAFVKVQVSAVTPATTAWSTPVDVYFHRGDNGVWKLVGLERLP